MIGVTPSLIDRESTFEFFELFKTPWEPLTHARSYDVVICDQEESCQQPCRLLIVIHRGPGASSEARPAKQKRATLLRWGDCTFPVYTHIEHVEQGSDFITRVGDNGCAGTTFSEDGRMTVRIGYDFFAEARYLLATGQPPEYAHYPALDIHIANLRAWILSSGAPLVEIPPIPYGAKFIACLTHDVDFAGVRYHKLDRTIAGFLYRALFRSAAHALAGRSGLRALARNWLAVAKLPLVYFRILPDFWSTFRQYRELEETAPSTFFFVPFKDAAGRLEQEDAPYVRAVKYELADLKEEIKELINAGCEIGVHGIDSWLDPVQAAKEISQLRTIIGAREIGIRMHWLYFRADSAEILEEAGYIFDSTRGYNDGIGYWAGTSQVYKPFNTNHLLEVPMHIMDTALFYPERMNLTLQAGADAINALIRLAARDGGVLCLNWHDRSLAPERLWDDVYRGALQKMRDAGAIFLTAGATTKWFRARRALSFEGCDSQRATMSVRVPPDQSRASNTFIRVYQQSQRFSLVNKHRRHYQYRDIPLVEELTSVNFHADEVKAPNFETWRASI